MAVSFTRLMIWKTRGPVRRRGAHSCSSLALNSSVKIGKHTPVSRIHAFHFSRVSSIYIRVQAKNIPFWHRCIIDSDTVSASRPFHDRFGCIILCNTSYYVQCIMYLIDNMSHPPFYCPNIFCYISNICQYKTNKFAVHGCEVTLKLDIMS